MSAHWFWPQYTAIILYVFGLVIEATFDGEPRTGKHNFAVKLMSVAISVWILWCGGFFA